MKKKSKKTIRKIKNEIVESTQSNIGLVFSIVCESVKLYFINLDKFLKYMTFPVLGQVLGIILIFALSYFFSCNFEVIKYRYPIFQNVQFAFLTLTLITLPGFLVFIKAFYDYLIAIGAICSMSLNLKAKDGTISDIKTHNEIIVRRITSYLMLVLITSLMVSFGSIFFVIGAIITFVYLAFVIQSFALNENLNIFGHISKSFEVVKGRFFLAFLLIFFLFVMCYLLLPDIIHWGFIWANWDSFFVNFIEAYIIKLPIGQINDLLNSIEGINLHFDSLILSKSIFKSFMTFIVAGYTLPIRSIALTLFFRRFNK
ncbi:MAG: hypothetical protein MRZ90_05790 [Candidatus Gastranaerophilales bacterium]|nr:hypothetical protein [Candidatus Gastranaerophilales bacterium]